MANKRGPPRGQVNRKRRAAAIASAGKRAATKAANEARYLQLMTLRKYFGGCKEVSVYPGRSAEELKKMTFADVRDYAGSVINELEEQHYDREELHKGLVLVMSPGPGLRNQRRGVRWLGKCVGDAYPIY